MHTFFLFIFEEVFLNYCPLFNTWMCANFMSCFLRWLYLMVKCGSLCLAMVTDTIKSDESFIPKNKKNIKIWFSPKSRKVRCCIEKPVDSNKSNEVQGKKTNTSPSSKDLSVFNFTSSSQESGSSSPPRGKANKKIKKKGSAKPANKLVVLKGPKHGLRLCKNVRGWIWRLSISSGPLEKKVL